MEKFKFDKENSLIFQIASLVNFWEGFLGRLGRAILLLIAILTIFNLKILGGSAFIFLALSLFWLVFEIFFLFKLKNFSTLDSIENLAEEGNLASYFAIEPARKILRFGDPKELFENLRGENGGFILKRADILDYTVATDFPHIEGIVAQAVNIAKKNTHQKIETSDLLLAMIFGQKDLQKIAFEKKLKEGDFLQIVEWQDNLKKEKADYRFFHRGFLGAGIAESWVGGYTLETEKYCKDITKQLSRGKVDFIIVGRDKEIKAVSEILSRSKKKNVILIGEPGVGKSTIVYGLAAASLLGQTFAALRYKRFLELGVGSLLAGASNRGELEQRIKDILIELEHSGNVVLYIPEIQNIAGSPGAEEFDITGVLLPYLKGDRLQVIATSTRANYHKFIEAKASFAESFDYLEVPETDYEETGQILMHSLALLEPKNNCFATYLALKKLVELSEKYFLDRKLPGKAIDLLDEALAMAAVENRNILTEKDILTIVSEKTKVPVDEPTQIEAEKLLNLENILHRRIVDQDEAVTVVSEALRRARTGVSEGKKPIGTFLFLGPTGVGKTETAKALSQFYFGGEETVIRLDMSEFQEEKSIYALIGAPPGSEAREGELTASVKSKPFSLILLDELEKAHKKILDIFLQVFDDGRLTDSAGELVSFTNTIIIATSNAGSELIREKLKQNMPLLTLKEILLEELQTKGIFNPEFLNRFDEIVVFKPLGQKEVIAIAKILVEELKTRIAKQDITLETNPEAIAAIARSGYDPIYGARPLRRFIADQLENSVAKKILSGELKRGSVARIALDSAGNLTISEK